MNRSHIEWCDRTWNPITGCRHDCPYCYARSLAVQRRSGECVGRGDGLHIAAPGAMFPAGFEPTYYPHRLMGPLQVKQPSVVFAGSMADMFGEWVPIAWLNRVMAAMKAANWHTYIILTKNPGRAIEYIRMDPDVLPTRLIIGTSITGALDEAERARVVMLSELASHVGTVLSLEPYTHKLPSVGGLLTFCHIEWLIVGGQSAANGLPGYTPPREWIDEAAEGCVMRTEYVPFFLKDNAGYDPARHVRQYHHIIQAMGGNHA